MIGKAVGQYRIAKRIGAGGMGVVYLAEHTLLGRPAAVKMLLPEFTADRVVVTRFFNEARAATSIRHPGIVEIYDFGFEPDGAAYIVMEYLQGETLAQRAKRGLLSHDSALAIARQIASALAAAHAKGIIHRDLKPDNVFLVPDPDVVGGERIKLLDFGIAKLTADPRRGEEITRQGDDEAVSGGEGHLTRTGAVMGTPAYMAPEQCRGVAVDHRADLYSLGCILFRLCAGKPPFSGAGVGDVLAAHIHVPPPAIASLRPEVPPAIEQLVQRLLVKDPEQRLGSAEETIALITTIEQSHSSPLARTSAQLSGALAPPPRLASSPGPMAAPGPGASTLASSSPSISPSISPSSSPSISPSISLGTSPSEASASFPSSLLRELTSSAAAQAAPAAESPAPTLSLWPAAAPAVAAPSFESATINTLEGANSGGPRPAPPLKKRRRGLVIAGSASAALALAAVAFLATRGGKPATEDDGSSSEPPPAAAAASSADRTAAPPPAAAATEAAPEAATEAAPDAAAATTTAVALDSIPAGATVLFNGEPLGKTPFRGTIRRQERAAVFTVRLAGYRDQKVSASALAPITRSLKLEKKRARPSGKGRDDSVNPF